MTDWSKHDFGPGTDVCARCKGAKQAARHRSKWCSKCDADMSKRQSDGALDPRPQGRVTRRTRIIR